jgi:hypothetical protein
MFLLTTPTIGFIATTWHGTADDLYRPPIPYVISSQLHKLWKSVWFANISHVDELASWTGSNLVDKNAIKKITICTETVREKTRVTLKVGGARWLRCS